ncbi:MAG: ABC transporter permease, partial [Oscillospiraceae bacterium]|nr:ABC transporter permease [Oscillospiraceae bacterium]
MGAYFKDILREIKNTMGRFVSLLVIAALGSMAVVGIQATSIDMRAVADKTYKERSLYDIQIKSSVGFEESDITALQNLPGVHTVMPAYAYDLYIHFENESRTLRAYALPGELNKIELLDGRLPQNDKECAVESELLEYGKYEIGSTVRLGLDNMDYYYNIFGNNEFTIVGVVSSPFFISLERGNTSLGDGRLNFYLYLAPEAYNLGVYTDVYILMDGSQDMDNLTDDYYDCADEWKKQVQKIGDAQIQAKTDEFAGARQETEYAPAPEWFYFTRKDGVAYDSYYQDTFRLQKIGYVFPLIFFLVALLVSLTTMSRMVEEHRTQIGIYKALGYHSVTIIMKYLIYAFAASGIGGALGVIVGSNLFPRILSDVYGHLYDMPPVDTPIPAGIALIAVLSSVGVVLLVTLWTCINSMSDSPANLMRPKAPPSGKRVLIERIPFLWNRFSFFAKVTARNIFRYKRRFVMTLAGVAGCSALLVTAFGLRDSVGGVGTLQY